MSQVRDAVKEALLSFDQDKLVETTKKALDQGHSPQELIDSLTSALKDVGDKFEKGEFFLAELVTAGEGAKIVISEYLKPRLTEPSKEAAGRIVIGTVAGDIHDIGKGIVASMLFTAGFEVIDLGVDVPPDKFVEATKENKPHVVAMSALLSTTLPVQKEVIEALKNSKLRNQVKVIIGGSPVTDEWAAEIGADGYGEDAVAAVKLVRKLLNISG